MATNQLFYEDNSKFFAIAGLRAVAEQVIGGSPLIRRCASGDAEAARALFLGFWTFVFRFEKAIDTMASKFPRKFLYSKFGITDTHHWLRHTSQTLKQLRMSELQGVCSHAEAAVREMQKEEANHSDHWVKDAENLGLSYTQLEAAVVVSGVQKLVDSAYVDNMVWHFATLAATEIIAEGLADKLADAGAFNGLFKRSRSVWMEVHIVPHDDGLSHFAIDMDLARACAPVDIDAKSIEDMILKTIHLFGSAANEVEAVFASKCVAAE